MAITTATSPVVAGSNNNTGLSGSQTSPNATNFNGLPVSGTTSSWGKTNNTPTTPPPTGYTTGTPPTLNTAQAFIRTAPTAYNPLASPAPTAAGRAAGTAPTTAPVINNTPTPFKTPVTTPAPSPVIKTPATPTNAPTTSSTTPGTAQAGTANQYNPLSFTPLSVPNDSQDLNATMTGNPGTFYSSFQNVLNHDAVSQGNRAAQEAVNKYNGEMQTYLLNGGANNQYGYQAPQKPDLTQYYRPAMGADSQYVPPTDPNSTTGGSWRPGGVGSTPSGVNGQSNVAPWQPPSTWTPNSNNTAYNPNNPNQGMTSSTSYNTGGQGSLNSQSPAMQYLSNVLGNSQQQQSNQQSQGNQQTQFLQWLMQTLGGANPQPPSTPNMPTVDAFGQYNPFGIYGAGLGNQTNLSNAFGLSSPNNNSFYFPQFV